MKQIASAIAVFALVACAACGDSAQKTSATTDTVTAAVKDTVVSAPAKPAFQPFDIVEINHSVKDYAKWKLAFDADSAARKTSGLEFMVIGKNQADSNNLLVVLSVADLKKAKDFAASPRLKDVMKKNGVTSKPVLNYYHILRFNPDSKVKQWVTITHKVKDFGAWVKVFDGEAAARPSYGLTDVVLARDLNDSNTVQIVFDITDITKAKARFKDPALKKLMTDAGVIGTPKFVFYSED
jgi:hypothetical protein